MKLLIAMYMQIQFELILTSHKAPIDNLKKLFLVMAAILNFNQSLFHKKLTQMVFYVQGTWHQSTNTRHSFSPRCKHYYFFLQNINYRMTFILNLKKVICWSTLQIVLKPTTVFIANQTTAFNCI
jgi:hypothetical protein